MLHVLSAISRPLGIAFGAFIVLNLALALQRPHLPVTAIWLDASLPEPWLSLFAGILGVCLLVPHELCRVAWVQWLTAGVIGGFAVLTLLSTAFFYYAWYSGEIVTDFPFPLSALLLCVLVLEFVRVFWWTNTSPRLPPPARVFLSGLAVVGAFVLLTLTHIATFGHRDFRRKADAAVVLGAKVYPDGTPCDALRDRLETAVELFDQKLVGLLIMTGARDPNGQSEPQVMLDYAAARGVPASRIILDEAGSNTRASAVSCREIARNRGLRTLLAVTQYFHCARVKMIFERESVACLTVPTCSSRRRLSGGEGRLSREGFYLLREAFAFPFYLIYYR